MNNRSVRKVINCFQSGDKLACVNTAAACGTFERLQLMLGFNLSVCDISGLAVQIQSQRVRTSENEYLQLAVF